MTERREVTATLTFDVHAGTLTDWDLLDIAALFVGYRTTGGGYGDQFRDVELVALAASKHHPKGSSDD